MNFKKQFSVEYQTTSDKSAYEENFINNIYKEYYGYTFSNAPFAVVDTIKNNLKTYFKFLKLIKFNKVKYDNILPGVSYKGVYEVPNIGLVGKVDLYENKKILIAPNLSPIFINVDRFEVDEYVVFYIDKEQWGVTYSIHKLTKVMEKIIKPTEYLKWLKVKSITEKVNYHFSIKDIIISNTRLFYHRNIKDQKQFFIYSNKLDTLENLSWDERKMIDKFKTDYPEQLLVTTVGKNNKILKIEKGGLAC
jgi:hypothetical protein